jgi:E3 ubiquitin-protein ligase ZNF598
MRASLIWNRRHDALLQRVTNLVSGSGPKLVSFKAAGQQCSVPLSPLNPPLLLDAISYPCHLAPLYSVRTYRNSEMSAADLIDTLWQILDRRVDATGSVAKGLADLMESDDKRREILSAWHDFRIEVGSSFFPFRPKLWVFQA